MIEIGPCTVAAIEVSCASFQLRNRPSLAFPKEIWAVVLTYPDGSTKGAVGTTVQDALDGLEVCVASNYKPTGVLA